MQLCLHTSVYRLVRAKQRERNRLYVWSSWSLHEWKQTTGAIKTDKWGQGSSPKVSAEHFSSHSSTKRTALHSPLLDGTANSFQMSVVYLAYWLNQLLQPTGTSHLPERQIWNFKTGDCSHCPFQEGVTALCEEGRLALHKAAQIQSYKLEEEMKASSAWRKFLEHGWLFLFFFNTKLLISFRMKTEMASENTVTKSAWFIKIFRLPCHTDKWCDALDKRLWTWMGRTGNFFSAVAALPVLETPRSVTIRSCLQTDFPGRSSLEHLVSTPEPRSHPLMA